MQAYTGPDLLNLCNNDYTLAIKCIQKFVIDISKGSNKNQKKDLFENLSKFLKLCHFPDEQVIEEHSKTQIFPKTASIKKRLRKTEIISNIPDKKVKLDHRTGLQLPEEIWLKVMNYLKTRDLFQNFALVNKYFHGLSQDSRAVKSLLLKNINDKTKYQNVVKVIKRSKHLKEVRIQLCLAYWKQLMSHVLNSSKLKSLKVSPQALTDKSFKMPESNVVKLGQFGNQLEHLELYHIGLTAKNVSQIVKISTLKELKIYNYGDLVFSKDDIIALAKNCKNLETLLLYNGFANGIVTGFKGAFKEAFDILFTERRQTLKKLTVMEIAGCVDHDIFEKIGLCYKLEELTIKNARLTTSNLSSIAQLSGLKYLLMDGISVNSGEMISFVRSLSTSEMKYLTFHECFPTAGKFEELSKKNFPVLERLYVSWRIIPQTQSKTY